jgi:xanthine dehydrogenase YagR molybdenum-binding subunit
MHRVFLDIGSQRTPSYAECAGEWDVRAIDVIFVEEKDDEINPLGVKASVKSALSELRRRSRNAVYHATGRRVRDLPITLDKLMRD